MRIFFLVELVSKRRCQQKRDGISSISGLPNRVLKLVLVALCVTSTANADQFLLRNGGSVKGTLLNAQEKPRKTYRIRLEKGGEVTLDAIDVKKHVVPTPEQQKYQELLARLPADSAELHWKMAEQCGKWSLLREQKFHLEQTIRLDPNHEKARRALKHKRRDDGTWGTLSEIMEEAGKVRRGGRWVTQQQADLIDAAEALKEAEIEWKKKVRLWRKWLADGRRRGEVLRQIEQIDDTTAIGPLVELFRSPRCDPSTASMLRETLAGVLARFGSSQAIDVLVEAAMTGSRDLQMECLRQLEMHGHPDIAQRFVPHLQSKHNQLVRRAGYALSVLGGDAEILPLIKALQTTHIRLVGGQGDGRINLRNGGLSAGQSKPKKVPETKSNKEVRSALVKLTGQDFRYNEATWLDWYATRSTPPNLDLRRDE